MSGEDILRSKAREAGLEKALELFPVEVSGALKLAEDQRRLLAQALAAFPLGYEEEAWPPMVLPEGKARR